MLRSNSSNVMSTSTSGTSPGAHLITDLIVTTFTPEHVCAPIAGSREKSLTHYAPTPDKTSACFIGAFQRRARLWHARLCTKIRKATVKTSVHVLLNSPRIVTHHWSCRALNPLVEGSSDPRVNLDKRIGLCFIGARGRFSSLGGTWVNDIASRAPRHLLRAGHFDPCVHLRMNRTAACREQVS